MLVSLCGFEEARRFWLVSFGWLGEGGLVDMLELLSEPLFCV